MAGELRPPRAGTDRLPLVIILHPAGGIGSNIVDWEQDLLGLGIATFVVDSFSGRGIVNLLNNRGELGLLAQSEDAYRALALLQKHPRIDSTRVVLMGFSRGGKAALFASLKRWQRMHGPATNAEFAGYIAFYPGCDVTCTVRVTILGHLCRRPRPHKSGCVLAALPYIALYPRLQPG